MTSARDVVIERVRNALKGVEAPEVVRGYRRQIDASEVGDLEALFAQRVSDYRATVRRVAPGEVDSVIAEICANHGVTRVACAPGLALRLDGCEVVVDGVSLSAAELDQHGVGAVTGCALAIAETGTIVLDGGARSGRRVLTLVPDLHVCLVALDQIVAGVVDAISRLEVTARSGAPITFVSGPSATSDIELNRVEGVHGPRAFYVLLTEPESAS